MSVSDRGQPQGPGRADSVRLVTFGTRRGLLLCVDVVPSEQGI